VKNIRKAARKGELKAYITPKLLGKKKKDVLEKEWERSI